MTISKGSSWGVPCLLPEGTPVFHHDSDAANYISENLDSLSTPIIALAGGALWTTMGGPGAVDRYRTDAARHYPCDLVRVAINGDERKQFAFIGSLIARSLDWRHTFAAMNAQTFRDFRFGHRAHPNDGLVDIYDAHVSLLDIPKIAKRARLGSHLPHPSITEKRAATYDIEFLSSRQLWLDERRVGSATALAITVVPDAFTVVL
jgi:hypothetical protein